VISLLPFAPVIFALTSVGYDFSSLVEKSNIVLVGKYEPLDSRWPVVGHISVLSILIGNELVPNMELDISYHNPIRDFSHPRPGMGLFFVTKCGAEFEIAGHGQGSFGMVSNQFMIQMHADEIASLRSVEEIRDLLTSSNRLGASLECTH
jgi:hypothetical protein